MNNEQGREFQLKNMEAAACLAELSTENTLKVLQLLAELSQSLFRESLANAEAQTATADAHETAQLRTAHARRTMRVMMEGAQRIATIGSDARLQFSRLLTEQLASGSHELLDVFQSFFKVLPAHDAGAIEAIERAMARSHSAFEEIESAAAGALKAPQADVTRLRPVARHCRASASAPIFVPPHRPAPAEPRAC